MPLKCLVLLMIIAAPVIGQPVVSLYSPTSGTVFLQPTNVPLNIQLVASVANADTKSSLEFFDGPDLIGSSNFRQQYAMTWSNVAFGRHEVRLRLQSPTGGVTFSEIATLEVRPGGRALIPPGAVWAYRDGGVDLGTAWRGMDVDTSFWPQGQAQLGFGDGDEVTRLDGINFTNWTVYTTFYFRHVFNVSEPMSVTNLDVRLLRDDGAIVYLNGRELFRDNMPPGEVSYLTRATRIVPDENEFIQRWMLPSLLRQGANVLAVEIHNAQPQNEDISFDLALVGNIPVSPPALSVDVVNSEIWVLWPLDAAGFRLETTLSLNSETWVAVPHTVERLLGQSGVRFPIIAGESRFFRLALSL